MSNSGASRRREALTSSQRTAISRIAIKYNIKPLEAYQMWEAQFKATMEFIPQPYEEPFDEKNYRPVRLRNLCMLVPLKQSLSFYGNPDNRAMFRNRSKKQNNK